MFTFMLKVKPANSIKFYVGDVYKISYVLPGHSWVITGMFEQAHWRHICFADSAEFLSIFVHPIVWRYKKG